MGFFGTVWDKAKDIGAGIISGILGTLVHYIYIGVVYVANLNKSKKTISDCLLKVLEDLDLFSSEVNLTEVRIIENAWGLAGVGLTNNYTIYLSGSFDEINDMWLLLHELKHVEQYQDWGYVKFVALYDYQIVRYGYENAPIEKAARDFANNNEARVSNKYDSQCRPITDPDSPINKILNDEDWTMILGLI